MNAETLMEIAETFAEVERLRTELAAANERADRQAELFKCAHDNEAKIKSEFDKAMGIIEKVVRERDEALAILRDVSSRLRSGQPLYAAHVLGHRVMRYVAESKVGS